MKKYQFLSHSKNKQSFHTNCNTCTTIIDPYDNSEIVVVFSMICDYF